MSGNRPKNSPFTAKRIRRSIKLDRVHPADFIQQNMIYCCEQCSFFDPESEQCLMSFPTAPHRREAQLKKYDTHSHMAFCRFLEID